MTFDHLRCRTVKVEQIDLLSESKCVVVNLADTLMLS